MQRNTVISVAAVAGVLLLGLLFVAFQRGAIYFEDGMPTLSLGALMNPAPNINRPISYPADFPEAGKEMYERDVAGLRERIESDVDDYEAWLDLAIYYRMLDDHEGAVEIWEYLIAKYDEGDAISAHNLAEYYYRIKKDYPRAEQYYSDSIAASLTLQSNYTDLYEMYSTVYKTDTNLAIETLKRGIEAFVGPERIGLKILLGRHYRDMLSDTDNARKYLTEARNDAREVGDRAIADAIEAEIKAL